MAYVVLARKYRPQTFSDLIGQEHVTRTLGNAIAHDRVHHAYLFCGARGLGKTTSARLLAKCLVCVNGPTSEPCNECSECTAVTEGRSVDVIEIDGASNNRVDDVRNLRDQVRYLPQTARRKIYIIDEVHMLTGSAFNALLKTLEEPPPHVTFIFATTEVHELPATILSRVSRFDFRRVPSARLVKHMQGILRSEGVAIEEAGLFLVARAGGGSVRDSLTLLDKVIAFADESATITTEEVRVVLGVPSHLAVASLADAVLSRNADALLHEFDAVVASGQDLLQLAVAFLQHLRNLVVVKLTDSREVLLDASEAEFDALRQQTSAIQASVLSQLFDRFARVVDSLAHTRVPRLILEMGFLDLVHAEPLLPLGDLIAELEKISSGAPALRAASGGDLRPRQEISRAHTTKTPAQPQPQRSSSSSSSSSSPSSSPKPRSAQPAQPSRTNQSPRSGNKRNQGEDLSAELWRMVEASGAMPGAPANPQDGRAPPAPKHRDPSRDHRQASQREHTPRADKTPDPPEEPAEVPPWPPDSTTAAPPEPHQGHREPNSQGSGFREPQTRAPGPGPGPREHREPQESEVRGPKTANATQDPTCATGACPGAPREPASDVVPWETTDSFAAWEQLLARISEGEPQLHGALADMGLSALADGEIVLVCPADQHHRRSQVQQYKGLLEELAHRHLGAPFKVVLIEGEPELRTRPSLSLAQEQRRLELQRKVDAEAREHPGIRALLDSFEGRLRGVQPLLRS